MFAIQKYGGNDDLLHLRSLYKRQHRMSMQKVRNIPAKPTDIDRYITDEVRQTFQSILRCFAPKTRYVGVCGDGALEIEFLSNVNGELNAKRIFEFGTLREVESFGKVNIELVWDDAHNRYVAAVCFQLGDVDDNGVATRLILVANTFRHEMDAERWYFEGEVIVNCDAPRPFCMSCVAMRQREIAKPDTLREYHECESFTPKHIQCINNATSKINALCRE